MVAPLFPTSGTVGALYFTIGADGTTTAYPTSTLGAKTTTASSGLTFGAKHVVVEGFTLDTHNSGENLVLTDDTGTTIETFTIPASTEVGKFVPFGIEGLEVMSGIGAKLSTGSTARYKVWFRIIDDGSY